MLIELLIFIIVFIITAFLCLVERNLQMSLRSQKIQQFGFGGIALDSLINIPCPSLGAQLRFHDDHILSPVQA